MPERDAASSIADQILGRAQIASDAAAKEFRTQLVFELGRLYERGLDAEQLIQEAIPVIRRILRAHAQVNAGILTDLQLAGFIHGANEINQKIDPELLERVAQGPATHRLEPPAITPPRLPTVYPPGDPGPTIRLPKLEEAAKSLVERRILPADEFYSLAHRVRQQSVFTVSRFETETVAKIHDELVKTIDEGPSLAAFQERMEQAAIESPLGPGHMENVYRTNTIGAFARGEDRILSNPVIGNTFPYSKRIPIHDARLTELCEILAKSGIDRSAIYRRDDPTYQKYRRPSHYNCFLPDTIINGQWEAGYRMRYSGNAIEITTGSGNWARVTVNHPVLAENGFISAGRIRQGDRIACHKAGINGFLSVAFTNKQNAPSKAQDVFSSLSSRWLCNTSACTPYDFYNDGTFCEGNIDVVAPDRPLLLDSITHLANGVCDFIFRPTNKSLPFLSNFLHVLFRFCFSSYRFPSSFPGGMALNFYDPSVIAAALSLTPFQLFRLGLIAELDAAILDLLGKNASAISRDIRKMIDRFARLISFGNVRDILNDNAGHRKMIFSAYCTGFFNRSQFDPAFTKGPRHAATGNSFTFAQALQRYPGQIFLDEVIDVRHFSFCGHVYDFQTDTGLINAGGIIKKNCRCSEVYLTVQEAARQGITEAKQILDTGQQPTHPAYVDEPKLTDEAQQTWDSWERRNRVTEIA